MAKVKLGLNGISVAEKVQLARQIVTKMTGNAAFTTPIPALTAITQAAMTAETAYNDAQGARIAAQQKTQIQNEKEDALDLVLTQLAAYVEIASGGDDGKILSAGIALRASRTTPTVPGQIQSFAATSGDHDGTIDLSWEPAAGAKSYTIDLSTTSGTGPWTNGRVVTKSSVTIESLTSGQRVWFRVAAIGSAGQGPWSDPATRIVP